MIKHAVNMLFVAGVLIYLGVAHKIPQKAPVAVEPQVEPQKVQPVQPVPVQKAPVHTVAITEVYTNYCLPCKKEVPILAALTAKGYAVMRVDDQQHPMGVAGHPTFILTLNGKEITRHTGFLDQGQLETWVEQVEQWSKAQTTQTPTEVKQEVQEVQVQSYCPSCNGGRFRLFRGR